MSQGLQCWDEYGRLIVDVGDYNMRYIGTVNLNVGPGANAWSVPVVCTCSGDAS